MSKTYTFELVNPLSKMRTEPDWFKRQVLNRPVLLKLPVMQDHQYELLKDGYGVQNWALSRPEEIVGHVDSVTYHDDRVILTTKVLDHRVDFVEKVKDVVVIDCLYLHYGEVEGKLNDPTLIALYLKGKADHAGFA